MQQQCTLTIGMNSTPSAALLAHYLHTINVQIYSYTNKYVNLRGQCTERSIERSISKVTFDQTVSLTKRQCRQAKCLVRWRPLSFELRLLMIQSLHVSHYYGNLCYFCAPNCPIDSSLISPLRFFFASLINYPNTAIVQNQITDKRYRRKERTELCLFIMGALCSLNP